MKIKEILQEAPLTDVGEKQFIDQMKGNNYGSNSKVELKKIDKNINQIGSGAFANVYGKKDSDTVIKIARWDGGAVKYLRWCLKNQANPHVPKLLGLHVSPDKNFLYARMEKLVPADGRKYNWSVKDIPFLTYLKSQSPSTVSPNMNATISNLLSTAYGYPEYKPKKPSGDTHSYIHHLNTISGGKRFIEFLNTLPEAASEIKQSWRQDPMVKTLHYALNVLKKAVADDLDIEIRRRSTMHNIMMRPNTGELVVTDPVAGL
jgi:hypothetical protein